MLADSKQYDDAISTYNKAISLDPQDAEAWFDNGTVLIEEFKTNEANAAIDHALLLNPNESNYNVEKGIVLGMQGKKMKQKITQIKA